MCKVIAIANQKTGWVRPPPQWLIQVNDIQENLEKHLTTKLGNVKMIPRKLGRGI